MFLTMIGFILDEHSQKSQSSCSNYTNLQSPGQRFIDARDWIQNRVHEVSVTLRRGNSLDESDSFLRYAEPAISETESPSRDIRLVEMGAALPFENVQLEYENGK